MTLRALHGLAAPAKLNLFLHVVGRRADGYHLLQSIFVLIDWADELHFERRSDGALHRHDLGPALPADDLVLRAARALRAATGCALGADIHVDKRVPWGAGMGGGSSDAATTLLALNRLWDLALPRAELARIGLALGADVPFFIGGENAFVQGVGEDLTPVTLAPMRVAVVKPPQGVQTRSVFTHPMLRRDTPAVILAGSSQDRGLPQAASRHTVQDMAAASFGRNDLQPAAEAICPQVAEAARWLQDHVGASRMTGSGSAVFARIEPDIGMAAAPVTMPAPAPLPAGWVMRECRSLESHPLRDWVD